MGTLVVVPKINRPFDSTLFADITTSAWTYTQNQVMEYELVFDQDLTAGQVQNVTMRCKWTPAEEEIRVGAQNALTDLRNIRDFVGTATNAQLTSAVKTLANIEVGLIRVLLNQLDAAN